MGIKRTRKEKKINNLNPAIDVLNVFLNNNLDFFCHYSEGTFNYLNATELRKMKLLSNHELRISSHKWCLFLNQFVYLYKLLINFIGWIHFNRIVCRIIFILNQLNFMSNEILNFCFSFLFWNLAMKQPWDFELIENNQQTSN